MTWPAYDPLTAAWQWLVSLAGTLTEPGSPFWWPTILLAVLAAVGMGLAAGRSVAEIRRQALPCDGRRALRHLGIDLACFAANAALPFLAGPLLFLMSATGAAIAFLLLLPVFGQPVQGALIETPVAMVLCALLPFMASDFALYWSHRLFHRFPLLWRAHRLHHAPEVLTPLTAFRFWPQEQIVHMGGASLLNGFAVGAIATAYGAQVTPLTLLGVNVFTLAWNLALSHLRHSHIALPFPRWLSYVLVSPHMHQAHHSADAAQHDKNFATVFALWDWIFGTLYLPAKGERFRFGVDEAAVAPAPAAAAMPR